MAQTLEQVEAHIEAIEDALASGVRQVTYDGRTVLYATTDEMLKVLSRLERKAHELDPAANKVNARLAQVGKGYL